MPVQAQIDVLVADIGGTNCRFQVWALDSYFRPSRMVVEKVGRRRRCLPPVPACRRCRRSCPRCRRYIGACLAPSPTGRSSTPPRTMHNSGTRLQSCSSCQS